ncbi:MAG: ABC transporter ATP-binding protein/permease [Lachnospiraceae bacterium]|nr:ABC transporter ATP-binding protein/permease [Lachnospiraceae bacterium]
MKEKVKKNKAGTEAEKDPNQKEYSLLSNMVYVLKGTFRFQKSFVFFMGFVVLTSVVSTYLPTFALSAVVDQVTRRVGFNDLLKTVFLFLAGMLVTGVLQSWSNSNIWWRMIDARVQFMMMRIHKVLYMDYEHIESAKVMEVCQKAMRATSGNTNGVEGMMRSSQNTFKVLLSGLTAVVIVLRLSPWMVLVLLLLGVLNYFNMDYTKKNDKKTWDELAPYWRKTWYMQQTMSNFVYGKDIRLFSMKDWLLGKYASLHGFIHCRMVESKNRWIGCSLRNQMLFLVQEGAIYAYLIYRVLETDMSIADFTLYLGAVRAFYEVLQQVFNSLTDMKAQSREINDFRTFLEYPDRGVAASEAVLKEGSACTDNSRNKRLPSLLGQAGYEFKFENVSFRYPESERYALKNLDLTLAAGERLAVVGLNGAGKSTFIKLLCGLYMPTEGRILLNGVDIRCYDKREYYKIFSPVFQNVELFAFPMDENVSMKVGEETDSARAEEYLRAAGLGEKLDSLPKGVKTDLLKIISEDGVELSGGESQKLALARALYKNAPVVVLDEPTSALDALAEYRMYQNFDRLIGKKSAVYISHRLSSTRFCDHVAMFADGELKEYGTHESLLAANGAYREMFDVQAQYYKEGGAECE